MPEWLQIAGEVALRTIIFFFMVVGLLGLIVPIFPGIIVIWLAALGYGIVAGFGFFGTLMFIAITLLMIVGVLIDNVLMGAKAREEGASWLSLGVGMLAGIIGTLVWPPFGGFIAAPLGIFTVEYIRVKDADQAFAAMRGLAIGCGWAFVVRFCIGVLMIGLWLLWLWKG